MKIHGNVRAGLEPSYCLHCRIVAIRSTATAAAKDYPTRPVRFIVGFPAGGLADLMARSLGQKLTEAWGQQVIVDNRAGASGVLSMQIVATGPRDGYTLLLGSSTQFSINPGLRAVPYDPVRDYTPVILAAPNPVMLTVQPSFPAKSVQDLIQLAKAKPANVMSYGSSGYRRCAAHRGGTAEKGGRHQHDTRAVQGWERCSDCAPRRAHPDEFRRTVDCAPHVKAGRLRALGVTGAKRLTAVPDVPTFAETGLSGFNVDQWYGVFAPAGAPSAVVRKLNEDLTRALASRNSESSSQSKASS